MIMLLVMLGHERLRIVQGNVLNAGSIETAMRGHVRQGARVGNFIWTVSVPRADVAGFMIDQLAASSYVRTAVGVA